MSVTVTSSHRGRTPNITLMVYDEEKNLTDADGTNDPTPYYPSIQIKKGESELVADIVLAEMARTSLGEYKYYWDTRYIPTGTYNIEVSYFLDGCSQVLELAHSITE